MNVLSGLHLFNMDKRKKAATVQVGAVELATLGVVSTIADIIQNKDVVKARQNLQMGFSAISRSVNALKKGNTVTVSDDEKSALQVIGSVLMNGAMAAIKFIGSFLVKALGFAVAMVVTPIVKVFTEALLLTFRLALSNPYTVAAAVVLGAFGAWRVSQWMKEGKEEEKKKAEGGPTALPSPEGTPPARPAAERREYPGAPGAAVKIPGAGGRSIQQIIIDAAVKYGIPPALALRIGGAESDYDPTAAATTSRAKGLFQFIPETWKSFGGTPGNVLDPVENSEIGARFIRYNIKVLRKALGRFPTFAEVYGLHFLGSGAASMFANLPPRHYPASRALATFLTPKQVQSYLRSNKPVFYWDWKEAKPKKERTVGEFLDVLNKKMGVNATAPVVLQEPSSQSLEFFSQPQVPTSVQKPQTPKSAGATPTPSKTGNTAPRQSTDKSHVKLGRKLVSVTN